CRPLGAEGVRAMKCWKSVRAAVVVGVGLLAPASAVFAQEPPPTSQSSTDDNKTQEQTAAGKDDSAAKPVPVLNDTQSTAPPDIRGMNSAAPLPSGRVSPVQLGPLYLQSVSFFDSENGIQVSGQPGTNWQNFGQFRTDIVFDHAFRTTRIAVQYEPRLTILNGNASTDTSNLVANWTTKLYSSPRLGISIADNFEYYGQQGQFDNLNLQADLTSGNLA